MKKIIAKEVNPAYVDFRYYFEDDGLTEKGGDYCNNLFIISRERYGQISGFNEKEYKNLQTEIKNLFDMYIDIVNKSYYAQYSSVGSMLLDLGLINSIHNTRRIKEITEWLKARLRWGNTSQTRTVAEYEPEETTAEYLTFKTGKEWKVKSFTGYCQGDFCDVVYCTAHYSEEHITEIGKFWLGCGTEFCIDDCYGYYVPDTIRWQEGETLRKYLADCYGCKPDEIEIYLYDGEHTVTDYKTMK